MIFLSLRKDDQHRKRDRGRPSHSRCSQTAIAIQGIHLEIETSIGIVFSHLRYTEHDAILRDADIAMYRAKVSQSGYVIF